MPTNLKALHSAAYTAPLRASDFAALMEKFNLSPTTPVALAVSGGPDSMALAWCATRWASVTNRPLVAFIVDHQLRPESALEAEQTQFQLEEMGLKSEILRWQHEPITSNLHHTARKARYALLTQACHTYGIHYLLLAHQREDQAETILMRFAKGSGIDGLCGMVPHKIMDGVHFLRPLLDVPKEQLMATCEVASLPVITDPSNQSEKFARGRLRQVMPLLAAEGFTADRLIDLGERAQETKVALDHYTEALLRVATTVQESGTIRFTLEHLRAAPQLIVARALTRCLQAIHTKTYPPERSALLRLLESLRSDQPMSGQTLNGCIITKNATHATLIREFATITDTQAITPIQPALWDSRWLVTLTSDCTVHDFTVKALGLQPHDILDQLAPGLCQQVPQGRVRAALPGLWAGDRLVLIPALPFMPLETIAYAELIRLKI